jgi:hypothetical protein
LFTKHFARCQWQNTALARWSGRVRACIR